MKKALLAILMVLFVAGFAWADVVVSYDHSGGGTDGYTLYWWETATPGTVWNKTEIGNTVREIHLDEAWFLASRNYSFIVAAYNGSGEGRSDVYKWDCTIDGYTPPDDVDPPINELPEPPTAPNNMQLDSAVYTFIAVP